MKSTIALIAFIALSVTGLPLWAGPNEAVFLQLRENRDKALADAAKPINDQYKKSLGDLLFVAVATNDKDFAQIIQFELQTLSAAGAASILPETRTPKPTGEPSALQAQLAETKWRLNPDKTFVLHSDGTTTSNWSPRPGNWKVVGSNALELSTWDVARTEKVSVTQGGTLITWQNKEPDQMHPLVAKKIAPEPSK